MRLRLSKTFRAAVLCALPSLAAMPAAAAFQTPLTSGQAAAMGNASLASDGDSSAIFANPAMMAGGTRSDAYFGYTDMFSGLKGAAKMGSGFMTGAVPALGGVIGAGVATFDAKGLLSERTVSVGYARARGKLSYGLAGKFLHHSYDTDGDALAAQDPVFSNGASASGFTIDAGAAYAVTEAIKVGLSVRNLTSPDVGLASEDRVPRTVQGGASWAVPAWTVGDRTIRGLKLTADVSKTDEEGQAGRIHPSIGVEKLLSDGRVAFRAGVSETEFTGGVGVRFNDRMAFDYSLILRRNMLQDNLGTHSIGLRVAFGGASK